MRWLGQFYDWTRGCRDCYILHGLWSQRVMWEVRYQVLSSSLWGNRQLKGSCHFPQPQSVSVFFFICLRLRHSGVVVSWKGAAVFLDRRVRPSSSWGSRQLKEGCQFAPLQSASVFIFVCLRLCLPPPSSAYIFICLSHHLDPSSSGSVVVLRWYVC